MSVSRPGRAGSQLDEARSEVALCALRSAAMSTDDEFTAADYDALPEVLTPQQVARILNTSDVMVRRWASVGVIPGRQFGNRWRFSKTAIEQMIREGTPRDQIVEAPEGDEESDRA